MRLLFLLLVLLPLSSTKRPPKPRPKQNPVQLAFKFNRLKLKAEVKSIICDKWCPYLKNIEKNSNGKFDKANIVEKCKKDSLAPKSFCDIEKANEDCKKNPPKTAYCLAMWNAMQNKKDPKKEITDSDIEKEIENCKKNPEAWKPFCRIEGTVDHCKKHPNTSILTRQTVCDPEIKAQKEYNSVRENLKKPTWKKTCEDKCGK